MHPTARFRGGRVWIPVALALVLGLAWGLARGVAARVPRATAPEARLPEGAGARLEEAMRHQALMRAERSVTMLRELQADPAAAAQDPRPLEPSTR